MSISVTVEREVRVPPGDLFAWMGPLEPNRFLPGYGPLPAVTGTSGPTGAWPETGAARTIQLADGSSAREEVTSADPPRSFDYRVSEFSSVVRYLARAARGRWELEDVEGDRTWLRWRYTFEPRSLPAALVLYPAVKILWRGYMRAGIEAIARLADREARRAGR